MNFKQVATRLTGISCPVFGVQWSPAEPEITVAQRVLSFLEDRRVLYNPFDLEVLDHCIRSIIEIRQFLTGEIGRLPVGDSELADQLRAMRAACRGFLDTVQDRRSRRIFHGGLHHDQEFFTALGELRSAMGLRVGILAVMYGLSVEDELATLLPPKPTNRD
jgi:hypothetical protein